MTLWRQIENGFRRRLRSLRVSLVKRRHRQALLPPTDDEAERIGNLREAFRSFAADAAPRADTAEGAWRANSSRLRERVLSEDPRRFLRWDVITETMFVSNEPFVDVEFDGLRASQGWKNRWEKAIAESSVGCPTPFYRYPASSGNLIHQAYHLLAFEASTGRDVRHFNLVIEFGGGYGSMCRLFFNQHFDGRYVLFDLPPFSALQQFFLGSLGLPTVGRGDFLRKSPAILCTHRVNDLREILDTAARVCRTLFLATWSLSESPLDVRDALLGLAARFDGQLIAYQQAFQGIDNLRYFARWKELLEPRTSFQEFPIGHLPGNFYLFGVKP